MMFGSIAMAVMMALTSLTGVGTAAEQVGKDRPAFTQQWGHSPESASNPVVLPELKKGDLGPFVVMLQSLLNDEHMSKPKLVQDGVFGAGTRKAVIKYQKSEADEGLRTDGVVDNATWKSITTLD